jgi:hypothetical protein
MTLQFLREGWGLLAFKLARAGTKAMSGRFVGKQNRTWGDHLMKKIILTSVCILALASPTAFAQTAQPTGGASSHGNVGPGASEGEMKDNSGTMHKGTTGISKPSPRGDASTSGADTAAGFKNTGTATDPGAVLAGSRRRARLDNFDDQPTLRFSAASFPRLAITS